MAESAVNQVINCPYVQATTDALDATRSTLVGAGSMCCVERRYLNERAEQKKVLALAQARKINVMLVAALTRCGCSMLDLFDTLQDLQEWGVSSIARTGLQFGCVSAQG
jgi:hypothetical protein